MLKSECLARAQRAAHESKLASARAALYATTFGGSDKLTQDAFLARDKAHEAATGWARLANMHPQTRAAMVRRGHIPEWLFGY